MGSASGLTPAQTTLVGFSQGAIMALESTQQGRPPGSRVVVLSGRFAQPPRIAHASVRTHLMHGDADAVMPVRGAVSALTELQGLGTVAMRPSLSSGRGQRLQALSLPTRTPTP
jgi:phospholipase/carboxylesterase